MTDLSCLHITLDRETELCIPCFETYTYVLTHIQDPGALLCSSALA